MKFAKPVPVKMREWFSAPKDQNVSAMLTNRRSRCGRKEVPNRKIPLDSDNILEFTLEHICEISFLNFGSRRDIVSGIHCSDDVSR